jgi:hypothetical protein
MRSLSAWSVVSLIMLVLAIACVGMAFWVMLNTPTTGPAEGAAALFALLACCVAALAFAVLGVISGLVGVLRSRSYCGLSSACLALNAVLCMSVCAGVLRVYFWR